MEQILNTEIGICRVIFTADKTKMNIRADIPYTPKIIRLKADNAVIGVFEPRDGGLVCERSPSLLSLKAAGVSPSPRFYIDGLPPKNLVAFDSGKPFPFETQIFDVETKTEGDILYLFLNDKN